VQKARNGLIGFMKSQELISELLGGMPWLAINGVKVTSKQVDIKAQSLQKESACPCCGVLSKSVHSHYEGTLLDLPWADYGVRVYVAVRRFRCGEKACKRKVFTEWFTTWISSYARRMARAWEVIKRLSIETSMKKAGISAKFKEAFSRFHPPNPLARGYKLTHRIWRVKSIMPLGLTDSSHNEILPPAKGSSVN
jgi:zinc-finger of transposase IS204/IS1001/IS1096/IS1165